MSADIIGTYAVAFCLLIGSFFTIVGVIGLLKFNTPMSRLHAPTKVGTVGMAAERLFPRSTTGMACPAAFAALLFARRAPVSALPTTAVIVRNNPESEMTRMRAGNP